jgi:hypothetical protein
MSLMKKEQKTAKSLERQIKNRQLGGFLIDVSTNSLSNSSVLFDISDFFAQVLIKFSDDLQNNSQLRRILRRY